MSFFLVSGYFLPNLNKFKLIIHLANLNLFLTYQTKKATLQKRSIAILRLIIAIVIAIVIAIEI